MSPSPRDARSDPPDELDVHRRLFDFTGEALLVAAPDGRLRHATPVALTLLGEAARVGAAAAAAVELEPVPEGGTLAAVRRLGRWSGMGTILGRWGRTTPIEVVWHGLDDEGAGDGWVLGLVRLAAPIAPEPPIHAEERDLAVLRLIARSTGHDLNNMLAPIPLSAGLLREGGPEGDDELVNNIEDATRQALGLVRQMHRAVRPLEAGDPRVPLGALVSGLRKAIDTAQRPLPPFEVDLPARLPEVAVAGAGLYQLLLNLCLAAFEAGDAGNVLRLSAPPRTAGAAMALRLELRRDGAREDPSPLFPAPLADAPADPAHLRTAACRLAAAHLDVGLELERDAAELELPLAPG